MKWKKHLIGSDGFVALVDVMGSDYSIVQAARISYGNDGRLDKCHHCGSEEVTLIENDVSECKKCGYLSPVEAINKSDINLIRYLMRHRHTTPFEMAELKLLVRVPMDTWRQWIRHRTASVNEYSTRYTEAIDSRSTTKPEEWRAQSKTNKQGSSDEGVHWPDGFTSDFKTPGEFLSEAERAFHTEAEVLYKERLEFGVAREQARKDLPLSTYTEAYWKIDLHNLFHFLSLRMEKHAQLEIREYATIIGEKIVAPLFPICWQAFLDYRLNARSFSQKEMDILRQVLPPSFDNDLLVGLSDREIKEFLEKI